MGYFIGVGLALAAAALAILSEDEFAVDLVDSKLVAQLHEPIRLAPGLASIGSCWNDKTLVRKGARTWPPTSTPTGDSESSSALS